MAWTIEIDFDDGSGFRDITALVLCKTLKRTQTLHNELKPVIDTCTFQMLRNATIINLLLSTTGKYIDIKIEKDSTAWFRGYLRTNFKIDVRNQIDPVKIECVDRGILFKEKIPGYFQLESLDVTDTDDTENDLLYYLIVTTLGLSADDYDPDDIAKSIDYFANLDKKATYEEVISQILFEYGYVYYFDEAGVFKTYNFLPTDISTVKEFGNTSTNNNIIGSLNLEKQEEKYEAFYIGYWQHVGFNNVLIVEDTTGGDDKNPCNIEVAASGYYPANATATNTVYADYKYKDYDIVTVTNIYPYIKRDSDIEILEITNYFTRCAIKLYNGGASAAYIRTLRIAGDAVVRINKTTLKVFNVANSDKVYNYDIKYANNSTDATKLVSGISRFYKYGDFIYKVRSITEYNIGDFVDIDEDYNLGINNRCIIVQKTTQEKDGTTVYGYICQGIAAYSAETPTDEGIVDQEPSNYGTPDNINYNDILIKPNDDLLDDLDIGIVAPADANIIRFNDDTCNNLDGIDNFDTKSNITYTATAKFGAKALASSSDSYGYIKTGNDWGYGDSCYVCAWAYVSDIDNYECHIMIEDTLCYNQISIHMHNTFDRALHYFVLKDSIAYYNDVATSFDPIHVGWNHIGFYYDSVNDDIYIFLNGTTTAHVSIGGSWDATDGYLAIHVRTTAKGVYCDDLIYCLNGDIDPNDIIRYYLANRRWTNGYDFEKDQIIVPNRGGIVGFASDMSATKDGQILGQLYLLKAEDRSSANDIGDTSVSTTFEEADLSALVDRPERVTAVYGLLRITTNNSNEIAALVIRESGSAETTLGKLLSLYFNAKLSTAGNLGIGVPVIIYAPGAKFEYALYNAGLPLTSLTFKLWGFYLA